MIVARSSVAEIEAAPEFGALSAEYAAESQIEGMPSANPQWDAYRTLEGMGLLHVFSAVIEGELVGFISIIVSVLPRYGVPIVVSESYFVARKHRATLAGLKLLKVAEDEVRALGANVMLVSAPNDGTLAKLLPRLGYRPTSTIFFKRMADA